MNRNIKYKAIESYGDCTTKFEVQGVDGMRVSEFISYIVSERPEDSGTFSIDGVKFPYDNKRGQPSISTDEAPCHLTIASVTAHGAYWQMDYEITTKNTTKPIMSNEEEKLQNDIKEACGIIDQPMRESLQRIFNMFEVLELTVWEYEGAAIMLPYDLEDITTLTHDIAASAKDCKVAVQKRRVFVSKKLLKELGEK